MLATSQRDVAFLTLILFHHIILLHPFCYCLPHRKRFYISLISILCIGKMSLSLTVQHNPATSLDCPQDKNLISQLCPIDITLSSELLLLVAECLLQTEPAAIRCLTLTSKVSRQMKDGHDHIYSGHELVKSLTFQDWFNTVFSFVTEAIWTIGRAISLENLLTRSFATFRKAVCARKSFLCAAKHISVVWWTLFARKNFTVPSWSRDHRYVESNA